MVELRKRKTPPPAAAPPQKRKSSVKGKPAGEKPAEEKPAEENPPSSEQAEQPAAKPEEIVPEPSDGAKTSSGPPSVGDTITLEGFGGEIETNDGTKVTLKKLVDDSKAGVVVFTYPKASTPGCKLTDLVLAWMACPHSLSINATKLETTHQMGCRICSSVPYT